MKRNLVWMVVLAFAAAAMVACGNSSSNDESAQAESQPVPTAEAEDFHAFDTAPVLVAYEEPEYPADAKRAGLEGSVMVKVIVNADGTVESASVLKSSDAAFEQAALDAAKKSRFEPAKLDGQPTKSQVMVPYQFKLQG